MIIMTQIGVVAKETEKIPMVMFPNFNKYLFISAQGSKLLFLYQH